MRRNLNVNGQHLSPLPLLACFVLAVGYSVQAQSSLMVLPDGIESVLGFKPRSSFKCTKDGYFGDVENDCRLFHLCQQTKYPNGKSEWRHWTYACGNQTMFNQLTLTCAFVDEAVPCQHASQFQYLNEVLHRPKEPFLTDADVTSGVSYYHNRLLSDSARARAEQQQQQSAQPQPQPSQPRQSSLPAATATTATTNNQRQQRQSQQVVRTRTNTNAQQLQSGTSVVARQQVTTTTPTTTIATPTTRAPATTTSSNKLIDFAIITNHETLRSVRPVASPVRTAAPSGATVLKARLDRDATVTRTVPLTPILAATFESQPVTGNTRTEENRERPARQLQSSVDLANEVNLGSTTTASANAITVAPTASNLFAQSRQQKPPRRQQQQPRQQPPKHQRFTNRFSSIPPQPFSPPQEFSRPQEQQLPQRQQTVVRQVNLGRELLRHQLPLTMAQQVAPNSGEDSRLQTMFTTMIDLRPTRELKNEVEATTTASDSDKRQKQVARFRQARVKPFTHLEQQQQQQQRVAQVFTANTRQQRQVRPESTVALWRTSNASMPTVASNFITSRGL